MIESYLQPLNPNTPIEFHLFNINSVISQILCFNRVKIVNEEFEINTFPNIYTMIFADSGTGKDKSMRSLNNALDFFRRIKAGMAEDYIRVRDAQIENEIEQAKIETKSQQSTYRRDNQPRYLHFKITSATPEGFIADREEFAKAGFGGIHWYSGEFLDYLKAQANGGDEFFMSLVKEAFDNGDTEVKSIKSDKNSKPVYGVPQTMSVHTVIDAENRQGILNPIFERGFARRCVVACPDPVETKQISLEKKRKLRKKALSGLKDIGDFFEKIYKNVSIGRRVINDFAFSAHKFEFTDEAIELYDAYIEKCNTKARETGRVLSAGIADEIIGRHWKMIKLACCIAVQEHSKPGLRGSDIKKAIYQIDFFGDQFNDFYAMERILDVQKLYDFIIENQDKQTITKTLIRRQNFTPKNQGEIPGWLRSNLADLKEYAEEMGMILDEKTAGVCGKSYKLIKQEDE